MEAIEWPTAAQYRSERAKRTKRTKAVQKAFTQSATSLIKSPEGQEYGQRIRGKAAAGAGAVASAGRKAVSLGRGSAAAGIATLGVGGTVAAVGAALGVGYAIGTGMRAAWQHLKPAERDYRKAQAFRAARRQFEIEHGRPMTVEEVRAMGRGFLDSLSTR